LPPPRATHGTLHPIRPDTTFVQILGRALFLDDGLSIMPLVRSRTPAYQAGLRRWPSGIVHENVKIEK